MVASMQRSLSSPVAINSSTPPTPSASHNHHNHHHHHQHHHIHHLHQQQPRRQRSPSRSPSPPCLESHVEVARSGTHISRSPTRASDRADKISPANNHKPVIIDQPSSIPPLVAMPPKKSHSRPSLEGVFGPPTPPPLVDPSPPSPTPTSHDTRPRLHHPLLQDISQYTNPPPPPQMTSETPNTTLEELAHLVRLSKYQERKRTDARIHLQRHLISTALSARLLRCGELVHRNLVDCFRCDDKKVFASLYSALIDVRRSCEETRRFALLEPEMEPFQLSPASVKETFVQPSTTSSGPSATTGSVVSFLNDMSATARETLLTFLSQIRSDPDYLATRLCTLIQPELSAITSFYQTLEPIDSVLPYHTRSSGRSGNPSSNRGPVHERTARERLLSFQRHDPLSALIFTCFANSAGLDSAEDRRRTTIWATACARLISERKAGMEAFVIAVLNVWASMRDWSGKSNMEWYLMKILEDGAFLLDRAEDQHGTRFNVSDWTKKDQIAAEEFYDRATDELFEVIDDEDCTGIPDGLLELGNEILSRMETSRMDANYIDQTRKWLIYKWLFSVWILGVVIHPESHGMMAEYHITEYGRQKILKAVALRATQHVADHLATKVPISIPPKIKGHVDNIVSRFKYSKSRRPRPRLLPARSATALRETAEAHPHLVISPADLVTMVNALFPDRRPRSSHSAGGFRSGAPSVSGFSVRTVPSSFDALSLADTTAESVISDANTSHEPLLDVGTIPRRDSPQMPDPRSFDDHGASLRFALHEMTQVRGQDVVNGSCHPCAERWAVVFIAPDGSLSTNMTYDADDEPDDENSSSMSDSDEDDSEVEDQALALDKDYHQLRDSILKLVEDFEIPQDPTDDSGQSQTFSNRTSSVKKYRIRNNKVVIPSNTTTMGSRNPFRPRAETVTAQSSRVEKMPGKGQELADTDDDDNKKNKNSSNSNSTSDLQSSALVAMLKAASDQSRAQSDFNSAHMYWNTLRQLNSLGSEPLRRNGFATLLSIFSRGPRDSIRRSAAASEEYDAWLIWLKQSQERAEAQIEAMMRRLRALRDKMWYVTDVRNSGPYEHSRNIAVALKTMGVPRRWSAFQRTRSQARGPASGYLLRTESQIVDLLAASEEQGGPNKLSDDQADKTLRWLQQYNVVNFCCGEERIHRFACEIENCVTKLVGDRIMDSPVLWSSELYIRDRMAMEGSSSSSGRSLRERDTPFFDDSVSVATTDPEKKYGSLGRASSQARDFRTSSSNQSSASAYDSGGRYAFSRASTVLSDALDGSDFWGASSPVHTINSSTTFWSPFHAALSPGSVASRAHSPTTSITNFSGSLFAPPHHLPSSHSAPSTSGRPATASASASATASSSMDTVVQLRASEEKTRFQSELRQTLTSLLLSDLGNLVFARGSETDAWFGSLGQECIERREAARRHASHSSGKEKRRSVTRMSLSQQLQQQQQHKSRLERKLSFGSNLRRAGSTDTVVEQAAQHAPSPTLPSCAEPVDTASSSNVSVGRDSPRSEAASSARLGNSIQNDSTPEFPFTKAYQGLLRMFCVHPNPYVKLNALHELQSLIVAYLNSGSRRSRLAWARSDHGSVSSVSGDHSLPRQSVKPLEATIDNVKERRSHTLIQHTSGGSSGGAGNMETRSMVSVNPANTDAIANVLQSLFRDAGLRPKTLFRDLQFIAAFVPDTILDRTDKGKAFWDAALAALGLKLEVCRTMVEVADEIVKHYHNRKSASGLSNASAGGAATGDAGNGSAATSVQDAALILSPPPLPPTLYSMADAARMWTITAKEGDPTAQRELALLYLSMPELLERYIRPLSRPREVFKQAVMEKYGSSCNGSSGTMSRHRGADYGRYHQHMSGAASGAMGGSVASGGSSSSGGVGIGIGGVGGGGSSWHGASGDVGRAIVGAGVSGGDVRSDPALICLAIHWMEAADQGGDEVARQYLAQEYQ